MMSGTAEGGAESQIPTQCVVIDKTKPTPPPSYTIPFNENSTRALSKKNRIYVLRDFLHRIYPSCFLTPNTNNSNSGTISILDVAGGKGDLSWILRNVDGANSIVADPRMPNHRSLVRSVRFLLDHPEEAKVRAVEGLPTHQPLAKLLPRLLATNGTNQTGETKSDESLEGSSGGGNVASVSLPPPNCMRIHVDKRLVQTLRETLGTSEDDTDATRVWDEYWDDERRRIESNTVHYGGTSPKSKTDATMDNGKETSSRITDNRLALEAFRSLDLIVGFHPDQATEATIDLALLLGVPFAVVPCCVFPGEFPERRTLDGTRVRTHAELVEYLCRKHDKIRKERLPFVETDTAKNVVLYMRKEDIAD